MLSHQRAFTESPCRPHIFCNSIPAERESPPRKGAPCRPPGDTFDINRPSQWSTVQLHIVHT